ncbi:hypothetical protein [Helicobacter trogontum]|uniref:Uncharacterized protein n=1 Tax=Helicobacter trogontum TaxID=50960 RepID=A0ABQ0D2T2_9HELI|nr:hypothetical protein [Helicobacter trogontum]MCI5787696.1 hypothetical protein [Helicobacter trogontum]MDY5185581.1 hypothetical protein [Helicobacter trogontum]
MGFEIFGKKIFDLSAPFSHFEAWGTIFIVTGSAFLIFLVLSKKAKQYKDSKEAKHKGE